MKLEHGALICGLRPAKLKALFRRETFSTLRAMRELDLKEPVSSQTLLALRDEGWICWDGTHNFIDRWSVSSKGRRLVATRLIKRFPVKEGREIVERVVAMATAINQNPDITHRVTSIRLFGSVLMGQDDDLAGDVDLVIDIAMRRLPKTDMRRIEVIEQAGAPAYLDDLQRWFWSERRSRQQIRKVSNRISLHPESDLRTTGAPHRMVYCYDINRECESPFDAVITAYDPETDEEDQGTGDIDSDARPSDARLVWPVAPNETASADHVDIGVLRRAQHLWMRGASLDIIAEATGLSQVAVQAYLASLSSAAPLAVAFDAGFRKTVGQAVQPALGQYVSVELRTTHRGEAWVTVTMYAPNHYEHVARISEGSRQERCYWGRCDLFDPGDPLVDAALIWFTRMKTRLGGLSVRLSTSFGPDEIRDDDEVSELLDFRPLFKPLIEVLQRRLPVPRERYSAYEHRIELELADRLAFRHLDGERWASDTTEIRLTKKEFPNIWRLAKELNVRRTTDARMCESMIVSVSGAHLPDHGDISDDIVTSIEAGTPIEMGNPSGADKAAFADRAKGVHMNYPV